MTLRQQIEAHAPNGEGIAVRYVIVVDWALPDGKRFLSRIGSETLTEWERDGLLHHALNGDWSESEDHE